MNEKVSDVPQLKLQSYTPEQLWFRLSSKRGLWDFWRQMNELKDLSEPERDRFYLHDVRNILNSIFLGINLYTLEGHDIARVYHPLFNDMNVDRLETLVDSMQNLPERTELHLNEIGLDGSREFAERILKKIPLSKKILSHLVNSIKFLKSPNEVDFKKLLAKEITLQELASFFDAKVNPEPLTTSISEFSTGGKKEESKITISGFEVNVIYNLLQNAEKFHNSWLEENGKRRDENPIMIYYTPESIVIVNRSTTGLSDNQGIFKLGVHGENGNTGYGLVISSLNAAIVGLKIAASSTQVAENDHIVTFEVKKNPLGYSDYFK